MKKLTFLVVFILISFIPAKATHLMGAEIIVKDLGNQEFKISLIAYRDTIGIPMTTAADINFDGPSSASFTLSIPYDNFISGNLLPMYPYGVEVYYFIDTVTLAGNGQWDIYWTNCCRNGAIQNLTKPLDESMTIFTSIVTDTASSNSSPFFLVPAAIFLPVNTPWQYNPLPFDPDGDSLHWSIDQPLHEPGIYCVGYTTPSSNPSNPFSIDPVTGTISWTANQLGNHVASILVDQYRNGVWVGEIRRDMQFIVVAPSPARGMARWSSLGGLPTHLSSSYAFNLNPGKKFNLEMIATHSVPLTPVYMGAYSEIFELDVTDASFTEVITDNETFGELNWTPTAADHRAKPYHVVFRISDGLFTDDKTFSLKVNDIQKPGDHGSSITVFPNPANDFVYLEMAQTEEQSATLNVYTLSGQQIIAQRPMQIDAGNKVFAIETASWTPGMYLIHVQGEDGVLLSQLLVVE